MAGPSITLYNSTHTELVSSWNIGTVQAQVPSAELVVNIWNNKGGGTDVSDLRECSLAVTDSNGNTATEDVARDKWIQTNVASVDGDSTTWTAIGGAVTKPIRANTGVTDNTIKGTKNDGQPANSGQNFCTVKLRVVAPINSKDGAKSFKIRLTGYYT